MSLLLSIFLGLKGLAIVLGTMISSGGDGQVSLEIASVELKSDTALVEIKVNGIYSRELNDFLESGTVIPLHLDAILISGEGIISQQIRTNRLKYDLAGKRFRIIRSDDTLSIKAKDKAKQLFSRFSLPLFTAGDLLDKQWYQIRISCKLGRVKLDILDMKEFDLMSLWSFKGPVLETKKFQKKDLISIQPDKENYESEQ
ncbi:hypothetical protein ACFL5V_07880 [Fibrobacterota bacterium]